MDCEWKTVVWERSNKLGKWLPYSGEACQLLEQSFSKNLNYVCLGDVDAQLKCYVVNLKDMVQISDETGTKCGVRRLLFDADSAIAQQVMWQWRGDGHGVWNSYSTEVINSIEKAHKTGQMSIDLSEQFPDYPYMISFDSMVQKNKRSKYHRPITRITVSAYPLLKVPAPSDKEVSTTNSVNGNYCQSEMSDQSQLVAASRRTSNKVPIMKKMSNFWNRLMKSSDSESENGADNSVSASAKKKQCVSKNSSAGKKVKGKSHSAKEFDADYAIVDGKSWTFPWAPNTPESQLKPVPGIAPLPGTQRNGQGGEEIVEEAGAELDILGEFTEELVLDPAAENSEDEVCLICYEALSKGSAYDDEDDTLTQLKLCLHIFHKSCVKAMYDSGPKDHHIQCPTCKTIHGIKHGNQPPGTMLYHVLPHSLPGHHDCDTIRIIYHIPGGIQGPEHPNPGKHYSARGFPRRCYLPDNELGRKTLRLLVKAWERRLIFTVGSSATTGEQNTVTWNEIHHKTEFGSNRCGHGYPDPNYFDNVISELAAQGVTEGTYAWFPA